MSFQVNRTPCGVCVNASSPNRGLPWVIGAFVICPCHLPLTLGTIGGALSGTVAGAMVSGHPYVAGTIITVVWLVATAYGVRQLLPEGRSRA